MRGHVSDRAEGSLGAHLQREDGNHQTIDEETHVDGNAAHIKSGSRPAAIGWCLRIKHTQGKSYWEKGRRVRLTAVHPPYRTLRQKANLNAFLGFLERQRPACGPAVVSRVPSRTPSKDGRPAWGSRVRSKLTDVSRAWQTHPTAASRARCH